MYWFRRPPYLRWGAGALLIAWALVGEFRAAPTVSYPFAAAPLPAGGAITDEVVDWRPVPAGLLPVTDLADRVTARAVGAGDPLVPSLLVARQSAVPDGWWALPMGLPGRALPGDRVQLVLVPVDPVALPLTCPGWSWRRPPRPTIPSRWQAPPAWWRCPAITPRRWPRRLGKVGW